MSTNNTTMKIKNNYFDGLEVTRKQLFLFIIIASSYFFEMFDNSIFNFTAPAIMATMKLNAAKVAQITSLYFLGNTIGGIFGGIISDIIGRRKSLLLSTLIFTTGAIINGLTSNFTVFLIARAMTGFGVMCMMVVTITYMAELSPKESRGKWEGIISGFGYLAGPIIGFISGIIVPLSPDAWRYVFYLSGLGYVVLLFGIIILKESPRWLMSRGRQAEAEEVVSSIVGRPIDLSDVIVVKRSRNSSLSKDIAEMFSPLYLKRTIVLCVVLSAGVVSIQITQPWITTMLKMSGFSMQDSILLSTILTFGIPLGQFVAAFFSDKGGRKIPIGVFGILYCTAVIPFLFVIKGNFFLAALFGLLINVFAIARNFIIHPYVAESLPTKLRNSVTGILNGVSRFAASGAQLLVPMVFAGYGIFGVFGFAMALSLLASFVVLVFGWRSAHRSLEEINENLTDNADSSEKVVSC